MKTFQEFINEGKIPSSIKDISDLNFWLHTEGNIKNFPQLKKYYNSNAKYDDSIIDECPLDLFTKSTGLTLKDLEKLDANTEDYEGSFSYDKKLNTICLGGAA